MKTGATFQSTSTDERFRVKDTSDCRTRNVVYLIKSMKCSIQYVRETENALCVRLTGYRLDINHQRVEKPVAKHFNPADHSIKDLSIMVIEKIHSEDADYGKR